MKWILSILLVLFCLCQHAEGQIPKVCDNESDLRDRRCCPNNCFSEQFRGTCTHVQNANPNIGDDPRQNWPAHYFRELCVCNETYGGVDCGSCAYGYYPHPICNNKSDVNRPNLKDYDDEDWEEYRDIIKAIRTTNSNYTVFVNGSVFSAAEYSEENYNQLREEARDITLYNFFVWIHYLVAKDSEKEGASRKDFAHESTGFLTWHRQMLLWLEWEIQQLIRLDDTISYRKNYYEFRIPFWDWTDTAERTKYFMQNRLGATLYNVDDSSIHIVHDNDQPSQSQLFGTNGANWETICWPDGNKGGPGVNATDCDPESETGPLKRCPMINGTNPCNSANQFWPGVADICNALELSMYDTPDYSPCSNESFRNYLEGFIPGCDPIDPEDKMCSPADNSVQCSRTRNLHNVVHIILGIGDIKSVLQSLVGDNEIGVMGHVAASPNDPIFINHHAMIDCIFDEWLKEYNHEGSSAKYPEPGDDINKEGHNKNDYIVPFIPVFTHSDMFKTAENFGYGCNLNHIKNVCNEGPSTSPPKAAGYAKTLAPFHTVMTILTSVGALWLITSFSG